MDVFSMDVFSMDVFSMDVFHQFVKGSESFGNSTITPYSTVHLVTLGRLPGLHAPLDVVLDPARQGIIFESGIITEHYHLLRYCGPNRWLVWLLKNLGLL